MCEVTPSAPPGFDFSINMASYMHVIELHICKSTTWYSKRFFVINTTLTCITQMIIWLCERMHVYMHMAFKELKRPRWYMVVGGLYLSVG